MNALQQTNLLVGKNAAGKTRTIKALQNVTSLLRMESIMFGDKSFKTKLVFLDPERKGWTMTYDFELSSGEVIRERLSVGKSYLIKRDVKTAEFYGTNINPPAEKLATQIRRDREYYPEIEWLMEWAEGVVAVSCSDINPYTILLGPTSYLSPIPFSDLVNSLAVDARKRVIGKAKRLGYVLKEISTVKIGNDMNLVAVTERGIGNGLLDFQLSSGMIRVLYILCFLEYIKNKEKSAMLLIDDLGEGLDYNRATLLGAVVFEACEKEGVQLIASSNDSFLMDVVDLSKWQIIRRRVSKLSVINQTNQPELFNMFRMTGLSNFDLFSSDFIDNYLARQSE